MHTVHKKYIKCQFFASEKSYEKSVKSWVKSKCVHHFSSSVVTPRRKVPSQLRITRGAKH